jgi:NADP-dependent 3-hydroxy acid dehydrogenase YdfG
VVAADLVAGLSLASPPPVLALRGSRAWKQSFERRRLTSRPPSVSRLVERGVYLITGGLGRIGLSLAEHLVRSVRANVVLVSRSKPSAAALTRVEQMRRQGAVLIAQADVADREQMRGVMDTVDRTFGRLSGVFHLAGATGSEFFQPIANLDEAIVSAQFRPKVDGARTLADLLADRPLDFVVTSSSVSTVLGGLGFGAYASANAFLDCFAEEQNRTASTPWISVAFDGWSFHADDSTASAERIGAASGRFALTTSEGLEVFDRVLALGRASQVVVSTCDLGARIDHLSVSVDGRAEEVQEQPHSRPSLSTDYVAPRGDVDSAIIAIWEDLLGIRPIGIDDNFFELGGHSLLGVLLMFRLARTLDVEISAHVLFEAPTIAGLSDSIARIQRDQAAEADRIAAVLREVGEMSDEEVERLLAQEPAS